MLVLLIIVTPALVFLGLQAEPLKAVIARRPLLYARVFWAGSMAVIIAGMFFDSRPWWKNIIAGMLLGVALAGAHLAFGSRRESQRAQG